MKITKVLSIALLAASVSLMSCKDEAAEKEAAEKIEMEKMEAETEAAAEAEAEAMAKEREANAVMVGGAAMYADLNIVENASTSKDLSTLVTAVVAAGLAETLSSEGPFTVFAPTNAAFDKLLAGTVGTLLKPENKETLAGILTYHVVSGNVMAGDLIKMINDGNGTATFATVNGGELTAMLEDGKVMIKDANGGVATVTVADVKQSNGVVHVIDNVLMPAE
jgi:uncharacterized surface protein with fasciclin (FAS1) repeats